MGITNTDFNCLKDINVSDDVIQLLSEISTNSTNYIVLDRGDESVILGDLIIQNLKSIELANAIARYTYNDGKDTELLNTIKAIAGKRIAFNEDLSVGVSAEHILDVVTHHSRGKVDVRVIYNNQFWDYYNGIGKAVNELRDAISLELRKQELTNGNLNLDVESMVNELLKSEKGLHELNHLYLCKSCQLYYRKYQMILADVVHGKSCCPHCLDDKSYDDMSEGASTEAYLYLDEFVDCRKLVDIGKFEEKYADLLEYRKKLEFKLLMAHSVNNELGVMSQLASDVEECDVDA